MDQTLTLPYMIGAARNASYAFYASGAIRLITSIPELARLKDDLKVPVRNLDDAAAAKASAVSQHVFGI